MKRRHGFYSDRAGSGLRSRSPSRRLSSSVGSLRSPLCDAVQEGSSERVSSLLAEGADANELGYFRNYGEPPLVAAVRFEHYNLVEMLLKRVDNVDQTGERGHTALIRACQNSHRETVRLLLEHNANPNLADSSGTTALYWAVKNGTLPLVELLLEHKADVNQRLSQGSTVLHTATHADQADIVTLLLRNGSNVHAVDEFGETPIFGAIRANSFDVVQNLLDHSAQVNVCNSDLRTPLHVAASNVHHNVDLVQLLLDNSAKVNVRERYGYSPLVLSLRGGFLNVRYSFSVPELLIRHGAHLNDEHCQRALEWSVISFGHFDLIRLAFAAGLNLCAVDWIREFIQGPPGRRRWYTSMHYNEEQERIFVEFVKNSMVNPAPLSSICRVAVRRHLANIIDGASVYYLIQKLPLPQSVIMFLLMEE